MSRVICDFTSNKTRDRISRSPVSSVTWDGVRLLVPTDPTQLNPESATRGPHPPQAVPLSTLRCPKNTSGLRFSSCFSTAAEKEPSLFLPQAARGLFSPVRGEGFAAPRGQALGVFFAWTETNAMAPLPKGGCRGASPASAVTGGYVFRVQTPVGTCCMGVPCPKGLLFISHQIKRGAAARGPPSLLKKPETIITPARNRWLRPRTGGCRAGSKRPWRPSAPRAGPAPRSCRPSPPGSHRRCARWRAGGR